jgi:hypothetical protein
MNPNVFTGNTEDARIGREWLIRLLEERSVEIVFTKKDGSDRTMKCTLMEKFLPETVGSDRPRGDDALAVYDLEKEGWRSFRWDSIKEVNFSLESENA